MAKIAFLSLGDPMDRRSWSGTLFSEYRELKKNHEVESIQAKFDPLLMEIIRFRERMNYIFNKKTYVPEYSSSYMSKRSAQHVNKRLREKKYDVVFAVSASTFLPFIETECPIIYMSDAVFSKMVDYYFINLNRRNLKNGNWYEQKSLAMASAAIFASDWARNGAIEAYQIKRNKAYMIPFGANLDGVRHISKKETGDTVHLVFIGIDWKRKGGDIAVNTVHMLNRMKLGKKFVLDVIGGGYPCGEDGSAIHLHGFIDKNTKEGMKKFVEIMDKAWALFLPTQAECAGIAFAEACAYGIPCITFDTGGTGTYVRSGINGYALPIGSAPEDFAKTIATLFTDKEEYERMCNNAMTLSETELNWGIWGDKVNGIIEEVLGRGGRNGAG